MAISLTIPIPIPISMTIPFHNHNRIVIAIIAIVNFWNLKLCSIFITKKFKFKFRVQKFKFKFKLHQVQNSSENAKKHTTHQQIHQTRTLPPSSQPGIHAYHPTKQLEVKLKILIRTFFIAQSSNSSRNENETAHNSASLDQVLIPFFQNFLASSEDTILSEVPCRSSLHRPKQQRPKFLAWVPCRRTNCWNSWHSKLQATRWGSFSPDYSDSSDSSNLPFSPTPSLPCATR